MEGAVACRSFDGCVSWSSSSQFERCRGFTTYDSILVNGTETCSSIVSWRQNLSQESFLPFKMRIKILAGVPFNRRIVQKRGNIPRGKRVDKRFLVIAEDIPHSSGPAHPRLEEDAQRSGSVDGEERTWVMSVGSPVQTSTSKIDAFAGREGALITAAHFFLSAAALALVDCNILRVTPKPNMPFFLCSPFLLSAAVTAALGYVVVPMLKHFKAAQIFRIEGPSAHLIKSGTPTMGGLFFVPVGLATAGLFTGFNSIDIQVVTAVTLAFAGIGLVDDVLTFWRKHNDGLPGWIKFMLQIFAGIAFFFLLEFPNPSSPSKINNILRLPAPLGLVYLGIWYLPVTTFCCAAMSNGVNLTDGLDGLAGGTAAVAFIGMTVAVLPTFPGLGVFGSSMAGACFGFLVHNRHKAKVFMGDTGSLALGGALAAMACCTGMFLPLFIASGVFVIETVSVMGQVLYFKLTKKMYGEGRRWLRMAPFHHHLEILGVKEPVIVVIAYAVSMALAIVAAYLGLSL